MSAATLPLPGFANRLLVVDRISGRWEDAAALDLPSHLRPGDLLVVNDAATLPGSLSGSVRGDRVEVRLATPPDEGWVVLFGSGTWRDDTDVRPPPPQVEVGDSIEVAGASSRVREVSPLSPRLVRLDPLDTDRVYQHGRPVQYSYLARDLTLDEVQTPYAGRPWAVEMPSAGRPLHRALRERLRHAGVEIASLTHAAGLSATGDPALDRALPLPERYDVPRPTWDAVRRAQRVIAVGTSVVRALESAARGPLAGTTTLRIGAGTGLAVVDGLLSGMHSPGESHYELMSAFLDVALLRQAMHHAAAAGYCNHEFGDSTLVL